MFIFYCCIITFQCYGELSQAFDEASEVFNKLPMYYQTGSGFEVSPLSIVFYK